MGKNDEIEAKNAIFEQKMTILAKNEQNREKTSFLRKMSKNDEIEAKNAIFEQKMMFFIKNEQKWSKSRKMAFFG